MTERGGGKQPGDGLQEATHFLAEAGANLRLDILLRKIDVSLDPGQKIKESGADLHQTVFELAGEGPLGGEESSFRAGMKDIQNGLSLGEVYPAVQEGPFGKFARSGHPCALFLQGLQDGFHHQRVAVTADFDQILAGVGARAGPGGDDGLIQNPLVQSETPGQRLARREVFPSQRRDHFGRPGPADPDQGQGRDARWGGAGGDGVFFEGHGS